MSIVFFLCSVLSLCYFLLIVLYSGISTDFCGIWIAIALIFFVMGCFRILEKKDKDSLPRRMPTFVYTSFALWLILSAALLLNITRYARQQDTENCDYVIVIGERVYEDGISSTLKKRLDRAVRYANQNPRSVIVLSGGMKNQDALPEAFAMYNYLIARGIPENRLLLEASSDTTAENISSSVQVIEDDLKSRMVPPPIMIGVLTSDYHVYRTMLIANQIYEDRLYVIVADSDPVLLVHQCVRECAALIHDRLTGVY